MKINAEENYRLPSQNGIGVQDILPRHLSHYSVLVIGNDVRALETRQSSSPRDFDPILLPQSIPRHVRHQVVQGYTRARAGQLRLHSSFFPDSETGSIRTPLDVHDCPLSLVRPSSPAAGTLVVVADASS